ncbi:MAG: efflux RND transporter periplasmic adaptor subunit [Bernardetiaceae bacterium]|jgi:membrane fusion protein (multidrug efflux system)|nr:efflux RND transporter periplasmic adaptor subunit [Bernardetiaceae bacterium]
MKLSVRSLVLLLLLLTVAGGLAWRLGYFEKKAENEPAATKPNGPKNAPNKSENAGPPQAIKAYVVKNEVLEDRISTVGTIIANEEVALTCETSGKITQIQFKEGSLVSKGQLLLSLNDADLQATLKKALIQKDLLEKRKVRNDKLFARQGVSEEEMETLVAQLNSQNAEIEALQSQIAKTRLLAPFSGRIGLRYVSEGSYVNPTVKIADLIDISSVKIDFAIPEKYMGRVRQAMPVVFTVAGGSRQYQGQVYAIEPKVDATTRTIQMRAISRNPQNEILPGAFATVKIILDTNENAKMIPTQALIPDLDKKKVFLLKQGKAMPVEVETGTRTETKIQITEGLNFGDTVITSGILQIKAGSNVKVTEVE